MIEWQWIPVAGLIMVSVCVLGRRIVRLYLASKDVDAPVACGGCKGCPSNAKVPAIVELKPKTVHRT